MPLGQGVAAEVWRVVKFQTYCGVTPGFADRLAVREREVKDKFKAWGQGIWKAGVGIYCDGKDRSGASLGVGWHPRWDFGAAQSEGPVAHPSGGQGQEAGELGLS